MFIMRMTPVRTTDSRFIALSTSMDPAIHPDVFARYEGGVLEIKYRVDDVRNFTQADQGMKLRQSRVILLGVHWGVDDAGRDRVEPEVVRGIFQRQGLAHRRHR